MLCSILRFSWFLFHSRSQLDSFSSFYFLFLLVLIKGFLLHCWNRGLYYLFWFRFCLLCNNIFNVVFYRNRCGNLHKNIIIQSKLTYLVRDIYIYTRGIKLGVKYFFYLIFYFKIISFSLIIILRSFIQFKIFDYLLLHFFKKMKLTNFV